MEKTHPAVIAIECISSAMHHLAASDTEADDIIAALLLMKQNSDHLWKGLKCLKNFIELAELMDVK